MTLLERDKKMREEGREEGREEILISLVKQGILQIDIAAQQLAETEEQFAARLQKEDQENAKV